MPTDTSEKGLETLIVDSLVNEAGYEPGSNGDYSREHVIDLAKLRAFLEATQPDTAEVLALDQDCPKRTQFLHRLDAEIAKRGVIDVLRKGVKHGPVGLDLFYGTPSPGNLKAVELHTANIFSVTRQLRYSQDETQLALDLGIFINGLPVATFELKNSLTKQTVHDAVRQYKRDRSPNEPLFKFGRCVVHFAVDDHEVRMCTHLKGKDSWFLPFDQGWNDGAGNPPNPDGLKTDYLWTQILTKSGLTDILENYAEIVEEKDERGRKKHPKQIFPRYHQLDAVRKLLADAAVKGAGQKYLIQHSAGSGKSNSIAWLAHQSIGLEDGGKPIFDSVAVITDRRVLDRQIRNTIKQFAQVSSVIGAVTGDSGSKTEQLSGFLRAGKKIVISTVQTFPFILDKIGDEHRGKKFAIIIDEAHSSQGGKTSAKMHMALADRKESTPDEPVSSDQFLKAAEKHAEYRVGEAEEATLEDRINRIMESRKMLANASYFAFTATPKNKTLEIFGIPGKPVDGKVPHYPFHSYTMKQAIQEGFILDVLAHYTPVDTWSRLAKEVEDDPEFDTKKALKKLRRYVESHDHAIRTKAEIMVDHFHEQVLARRKIGGRARAMIICTSIKRAIQYYEAVSAYLKERKSPYHAIVAFSDFEEDGKKVTEASLNGFPSSKIEEYFKANEIKGIPGKDPYRFLIVADKFQTGYDEPLLHTMYVDKVLSGIKAVQTLSRLNRAHPQKTDTFVLDFMNDADTITMAFSDYYRTTVLSEETDANKLHDLKAALDGYQVYNDTQVDALVRLFLEGEGRDKLDPILDACVGEYNESLDEDGQVDFKGKAKAFIRAYQFLGSILPYMNAEWEKLSIFLNFLIPKLPAPVEQDLSKGILESIDMDSYRAEVQQTMTLALPDEDAVIFPLPMGGGGRVAEPELDYLSNIIKSFNDRFGNIEWEDTDRIRKVITQEIPARVKADQAYQNAMKNSSRSAARLEHDRALQKVVIEMLSDHTELFKQFSDNPGFKKWLSDTIFGVTYEEVA